MSKQLQFCPLCDSPRQVEIYVAKDRHYGIQGWFRLVQCADCRLIFLNPMFTDEELAALYPNDYYAYQDHFQNHSAKEVLRRLLGLRIRTRDPRFGKPGNILDVGCGSGWFLRGMRAQGWNAYGVEVNPAAARMGKEKEGLDIFCGPLQGAGFEEDFFDYVRLNHSFEHMTSPHETLAEIRRILKPTGKLMIGVPNVDGLNARLFRQYWWYLGVPVHPFGYSVQTLSRLLRRHRFAVAKITYNSDYSGILGSFQIWLNRHTQKKSSEGNAINSMVLKVLSQRMAKVLDLFKVGDAIEITATKEVGPA